jgi:GNAT superfamily N-acetyltransferase
VGGPRHGRNALAEGGRRVHDLVEQGAGLGRHLLRDALVRAVKVADDVGVRALHVHAKDDAVRTFYVKFGFAPSPVDDAHLQLPLKTIRASLGAAGTGDSA